MKQSRLMSFVESAINILVGFGISLTAQWLFLPLLGVAISFTQNVMFAVIMTAISIARSYLLRRLFEALHIRRPLSPMVLAVVAERFRQKDSEGWTDEHDDKEHATGEIAQAGASYLLFAARQFHNAEMSPAGDSYSLQPLPHAEVWPWSDRWWKPADFRRNLVKACALAVAEGEKFDRQRKRKSSPQAEAT